MVMGASMPKKKPKKPEPKHPPSPLEQMPTRDLLRSIRDDLEQKAREAGLVYPEKPAKPKKS
jgi:hypothetical protein